MRDWRDLGSLRRGTPTQRAAMAALDACAVLERLRAFDPVLAGTVPIDIDVADSDLDVLCHAPHLDAFADVVTDTFGDRASFEIHRHESGRGGAVVASFRSLGVPVEIYGESQPVERQRAFRHMLVEHRLLELGGTPLRDLVRRLKREGLKTEPAFARILRLRGDPYESMLALEGAPDDALRRMLERAGLAAPSGRSPIDRASASP